MKSLIATIAFSSLVLIVGSQAGATALSVVNGDFEDAYALTNTDANGSWELGAAGWTHSGTAGTFDPDDSSGNIYTASSDPLGRVGFISSGGSLAQDLGTVIAAGTDYTLSALFGHRTGVGFGGSFSFTANGVAIGTTTITDPGDGLWASQSLTLDAAFLANYVGQQLGIIFVGIGQQINIDDVVVSYVDNNQVVPLPGAIWLFGSALLGGGLIRRRKKAKAA